MSQPDELRVIEALRAYTGGLTVTDQDISIAHDRLRDRLEPPAPRRRLGLLAAAVAAVLVVGFFVAQAINGDTDSAPPANKPSPAQRLEVALQAQPYDLGTAEFTAGQQPTVQDLAGVWLLREPYGFAMVLDAAGDWWMGLPTGPAMSGTSTLAGPTWTRRLDGGRCTTENDMSGVTQPWHVSLAADGSLRAELNASAANCTPADNREVWDRVAPGSPVADYLLAGREAAPWRAAPRTFRWQGLYVAPASGHLLEVTDDEHYRFYTDLSARSLTAADRGEIYFDSVSSGSCTGGSFSGNLEVTQLPGVEGYVGSYEAVRVSNATGCASGVGADDVWVKISS